MQAENLHNVQKNAFWQKALGVNVLKERYIVQCTGDDQQSKDVKMSWYVDLK